jgi:hypothetical protein
MMSKKDYPTKSGTVIREDSETGDKEYIHPEQKTSEGNTKQVIYRKKGDKDETPKKGNDDD